MRSNWRLTVILTSFIAFEALFALFNWQADAMQPPNNGEASTSHQVHTQRRTLDELQAAGPNTLTSSVGQAPSAISIMDVISRPTHTETFERLLIELQKEGEGLQAALNVLKGSERRLTVIKPNNLINEIHRRLETLQLQHEHSVGNGNVHIVFTHVSINYIIIIYYWVW